MVMAVALILFRTRTDRAQSWAFHVLSCAHGVSFNDEVAVKQGFRNWRGLHVHLKGLFQIVTGEILKQRIGTQFMPA